MLFFYLVTYVNVDNGVMHTGFLCVRERSSGLGCSHCHWSGLQVTATYIGAAGRESTISWIDGDFGVGVLVRFECAIAASSD